MSTSTERAKLTFPGERAREILSGDDAAYRVIRDEICDTTRWSIVHALIIQRIEDSRFFRGGYSKGATECQDESAWQYDDAEFTEVFPVEQVTIVYK